MTQHICRFQAEKNGVFVDVPCHSEKHAIWVANILVSADINAFATKTEFEYSGRKFCKDCVYHACTYENHKGKWKHFCKSPKLTNIITGEPSDPAVNRNSQALCGTDGKHWTPREMTKELRANQQGAE
jgi:hypothetical protein